MYILKYEQPSYMAVSRNKLLISNYLKKSTLICQKTTKTFGIDKDTYAHSHVHVNKHEETTSVGN